MEIRPFSLASFPNIIFGAGKIRNLAKLLPAAGGRVMVITGAGSFESSPAWPIIQEAAGRDLIQIKVAGEPAPDLIDQVVEAHRESGVEMVLGLGGGSVLDAGKAISGMLRVPGSVVRFLEGVGTGEEYPGPKVPYIAIPTTAGTGSETTKNAVLSRPGANGFKKSIRHDLLIPEVALVDPELHLTTPPATTAACGMDAFTQLLEGLVSTGSNPITDALAISGLKMLIPNLMIAVEQGGNLEARGAMAYAATLSGIVLANAGLGLVHGIAGALGGLFPIPHGVACATMMAPCFRTTTRRLIAEDPSGLALAKLAEVGAFAAPGLQGPDAALALVDLIEEMTTRLAIPGLEAFGVRSDDLDRIIRESGNKNNPVKLTREEIFQALTQRMGKTND